MSEKPFVTLKSFRLKNFKAIRDSGEVKFTPLTVFIGNNGSGKSSLIEALETLQSIVEDGLDIALNRRRGIENIRNKTNIIVEQDEDPLNPVDYDLLHETDHVKEHGYADEKPDRSSDKVNPVIEFLTQRQNDSYTMQIASSENNDEVYIQHESLSTNDSDLILRYDTGDDGTVQTLPEGVDIIGRGDSALRAFSSKSRDARHFQMWISDWQFMTLNPLVMGNSFPQSRTGNKVRLASDGSNIAQYLLDIRKLDLAAFEGIIETLQYVLPYLNDLQPNLTSELERTVYLQMTEKNYKVPGWLLSTSALRILALLAVFRHPTPPTLIVIEEIENGLDPRSIHLIVEELRNVIETGLTQVIITTHSPYLLDLLALSQIVLVERIDGQPKFSRPSDQESLEEWAKSFGPGSLYTMSKLGSKATE